MAGRGRLVLDSLDSSGQNSEPSGSRAGQSSAAGQMQQAYNNQRNAHYDQQRIGVSSHGLRTREMSSPFTERSYSPQSQRAGATSSRDQEPMYGLSEMAGPAPVDRQKQRETLESREDAHGHSSSLAEEEQDDLPETTAPAPAPFRHTNNAEGSLETGERQMQNGPSSASPADTSAPSKFLTQLYIISYLILFAILGTLARLGVQWITFYPGAPSTFSNIWANFGGTLLMGFFSEDRKLFMQEWGEAEPNSHKRANYDSESSDSRGSPGVRAKHLKVKKTIPLYIGLTTGFCGSFTSFSTFMRDTFLALANEMSTPVSHPTTTAPATSTVPRNGGYSFEAILAVIILTVTASLGALKLGAHIAIAIDRITPTLPFKLFRRVLDPLAVFLGFGCWIGAVIMSAVPPDRPDGPASNGSWGKEVWRGQVLFALVFAPLGCLLRFYLSAKLNAVVEGFPLGTFAANIFGTAVFGMAYDLQRAPLLVGGAAVAGGGRIGCQVFQGIEDGFCGCLTTVSTWALELTTLRRKNAYIYGSASTLIGLALLVVIMGSVAWSIGFLEPVCAVEVS